MTVRKPKYSPRTDTVDRLIRLGNGLQQMQNTALKAHEMTYIEAGVLSLLLQAQFIASEDGAEPMDYGTTKLAQELMCSKPTVTDALNNLEERGLIRRRRAGRSVKVQLTDPMGTAAASRINIALGRLSSDFSDKKRIELHRLLDHFEAIPRAVTPRRTRRIRETV